jgi:hypothetical protein
MRTNFLLYFFVTCVASCSSVPAVCDNGACGDGGGNEAGMDVPQSCDLMKEPKDSPDCVDDSVGAFVSPMGKDSNPGTKSAPVATLAKAFTLGKKRVYVCEGSFTESADLTSTISIYGGFACNDWRYNGMQPKFTGANPTFALRIGNATGVSIADLSFTAKDGAPMSGESSIAVVVISSTVAFARVAATGGIGAAGATGQAATNYSGMAQAGANGTVMAGGAGGSSACMDSSKWHGGDGGALSAGGGDGTAMPTVGTANGGLGGSSTCTDGTVGANGAVQAMAAAGGASSGTLDMMGWTSAVGKGAAGGVGNPGQGGGGGGGKSVLGGGGGGCGGCGGAGGTGGLAGGSSFAFALFNATVTLVGSTAKAGIAGSGGKGADGQDGQAGGAIGIGACNGGTGGAGGGGGGGGGGAGGSAAGIVYLGSAPMLMQSQAMPGTKGAAGGAGVGGKGAGSPGKDGLVGADGKQQDILGL